VRKCVRDEETHAGAERWVFSLGFSATDSVAKKTHLARVVVRKKQKKKKKRKEKEKKKGNKKKKKQRGRKQG